jgi:hypothetical protein
MSPFLISPFLLPFSLFSLSFLLLDFKLIKTPSTNIVLLPVLAVRRCLWTIFNLRVYRIAVDKVDTVAF